MSGHISLFSSVSLFIITKATILPTWFFEGCALGLIQFTSLAIVPLTRRHNDIASRIINSHRLRNNTNRVLESKVSVFNKTSERRYLSL